MDLEELAIKEALDTVFSEYPKDLTMTKLSDDAETSTTGYLSDEYELWQPFEHYTAHSVVNLVWQFADQFESFGKRVLEGNV